MIHLQFVRSPYAHARVTHIDVTRAAEAPGVLCVLTGEQVAAHVQPFIELGPGCEGKIVDLPMAVGKTRYQGEPVVAIIAETSAAAADAAELVEVDYEPLEPVIDAEAAVASKSLLHEPLGSNVNWHGE